MDLQEYLLTPVKMDLPEKCMFAVFITAMVFGIAFGIAFVSMLLYLLWILISLIATLLP
jgi:hypothetical protein